MLKYRNANDSRWFKSSRGELYDYWKAGAAKSSREAEVAGAEDMIFESETV